MERIYYNPTCPSCNCTGGHMDTCVRRGMPNIDAETVAYMRIDPGIVEQINRIEEKLDRLLAQ